MSTIEDFHARQIYVGKLVEEIPQQLYYMYASELSYYLVQLQS